MILVIGLARPAESYVLARRLKPSEYRILNDSDAVTIALDGRDPRETEVVYVAGAPDVLSEEAHVRLSMFMAGAR